MEKIAHYRSVIQRILSDYVQSRNQYKSDTQLNLLFDVQHDHYQILLTGWSDTKQVFLVVFHFDIIGEKIWLQQNNTDYDIAKDLVAAGIPQSDIVLGFYSPAMRKYSDYAVA